MPLAIASVDSTELSQSWRVSAGDGDVGLQFKPGNTFRDGKRQRTRRGGRKHPLGPRRPRNGRCKRDREGDRGPAGGRGGGGGGGRPQPRPRRAPGGGW